MRRTRPGWRKNSPPPIVDFIFVSGRLEAGPTARPIIWRGQPSIEPVDAAFLMGTEIAAATEKGAGRGSQRGAGRLSIRVEDRPWVRGNGVDAGAARVSGGGEACQTLWPAISCPMTAREIYEREIATNPRFEISTKAGEGVVIVGGAHSRRRSLRSRR
jgi:hypothetical protein